VLVYPGADFLGTQMHDSVVVGQTTTAQWVQELGAETVLWRLARTTFNSFWGQFGWMAAPLPKWMYPPLLLYSLVVLVGVAWSLRGLRTLSPKRQHQFAVLTALLALNLLLYLTYNLFFIQHQARYLFVSLIPLGVGMALGSAVWLRPLLRRSQMWGYLLPLALGTGLLGLNLFALWRIIPCLAYAAC
jgi:hypothetical protein